MKLRYLLLLQYSISITIGDLRAHGFSADTIIWTGDRQTIQAVCEEVVCQSIEHYTPSYDITRGVPMPPGTDASQHSGSISHGTFCKYVQDSWVRIKGAARSVTNCFIRITVGPRSNLIIRCSPLQEFYLPLRRAWVPAIDLEVGDELLCEHSLSCPVLDIELITEALPVYAISVEHPHTYFVGSQGILTHNIPLPAVDIAFTIPWDMVFTTGGRIALELGPATCGISIAVAAGIGIGYTLYRATTDTAATLDTYGIAIDTQALNAHLSKKKQKHSTAASSSTSKQTNGTDKKKSGGSGGGGPRDPKIPEPKDPKKRNTDTVANMYELFKRIGFGTALKDIAEPTSQHHQGAKIFRAIQDLIAYGIKKGDQFYLDMLHKNHIEVFNQRGEIPRTVLRLNGSVDYSALAKIIKEKRSI